MIPSLAQLHFRDDPPIGVRSKKQPVRLTDTQASETADDEHEQKRSRSDEDLILPVGYVLSLFEEEGENIPAWIDSMMRLNLEYVNNPVIVKIMLNAFKESDLAYVKTTLSSPAVVFMGDRLLSWDDSRYKYWQLFDKTEFQEFCGSCHVAPQGLVVDVKDTISIYKAMMFVNRRVKSQQPVFIKLPKASKRKGVWTQTEPFYDIESTRTTLTKDAEVQEEPSRHQHKGRVNDTRV